MTFRASHLYRNGPEVEGAFGVNSIPLTVVAHIISFLDDDVASLARLCRTSRVLWYMTLPHLWKNVTLKSYSAIRYREDVPEGFGSASPFAMGLNALVTRNVSSLVRSLSLEGEFSSADVSEHARVGRVSESTMILNIAVRAVLDQCTHLENFRWDLNIRTQPNVYAGLAKLERLESLWIRFPSNRSPQPSYELPPLPNLRSLTFTHYDPLCYPDDVSTLLLHGTKLENLVMHFSPRMREQGEPSVILTHFFRKIIAAKRRLRLKSMGVYNLLNSVDPTECLHAVDTTGIEHVTSVNTFGPDEDAPVVGDRSGPVNATHFIDRTWHMIVKAEEHAPSPKSLRIDQLHRRHAQDLGNFGGLEKLYLINARYKHHRPNGAPMNNPDESSSNSADSSPYYKAATDDVRSSRNTPVRAISAAAAASISLRDLYLDNICNVCGPTLRHLILPARWPLPTAITARLIRTCPNLTQLAAALDCVEDSKFEALRLLIPFLRELWALRVLAPLGQEACGEEGRKNVEAYENFVSLPDDLHEEKISSCLIERGGGPSSQSTDFAKLKYVGVGWKVWEIGPVLEEHIGRTGQTDDGYIEDGTESQNKADTVYRRRLKRIEEKDVQHVEIWRMDSLDIV
ncbi:hypothetical protein G647_08052 [Cladophialophora carrionii CBS 160.54]|uniref:F-box domain-containing protein n=1 Tax=Cladophialophora carrionii CBS 160.54 TaxID=1279043 RepID=V9D4A8_9EURO|nr:uncharacterized protein G647_08052 [Cladophialophora carrionii CBS 160.54]ETI21705.1 hypothetical protein G647_08052 [Cladophialophora carrionii CBS 160.54]